MADKVPSDSTGLAQLLMPWTHAQAIAGRNRHPVPPTVVPPTAPASPVVKGNTNTVETPAIPVGPKSDSSNSAPVAAPTQPPLNAPEIPKPVPIGPDQVHALSVLLDPYTNKLGRVY